MDGPPLEKYWGGPAPLGPPRIDASATAIFTYWIRALISKISHLYCKL